MIKTNFIGREIDNLDYLAVEVPDMWNFIEQKLHPAFSKAIETNELLRNLITRAINNGILFKNAKAKDFRNYWLPLANAGLSAVPRSCLFHESTFFIHDVLHHNFPDLLIDKKTALLRKVYIIHRMLSEATTLVLADAFAIDCALKTGLVASGERVSPSIYPCFKKKYPNIADDADELCQAITDNCGFALLGEVSEELEPFCSFYKVIYEGDYKWTAHNHDNFKINTEWLEFVKANKTPNVIFLSEFIEELAITDEMSNLQIFERVKSWYFNIIFDTKKHCRKDYYECYRSAHDLFVLFNAKGFLEQGGETSELAYSLKNDNLQEFYLRCQELNPQRETQGGIFPLFDNMYISYDGKYQEKASLAEVANRVLDDSDAMVRFREMINLCGGNVVRSNIVSKIGVAVLSQSFCTLNQELKGLFNLDVHHPDIDMNAKVNRLSDNDIMKKVYKDFGHKSIANNATISFLIAGLSMSSLLEFCSSSANMNRLNTDKASVLLKPLYTVLDEKEIKFIERFYRENRTAYLQSFGTENLELANRFGLKSQAMACIVSFSLQDWEWFLQKRLASGNDIEAEFRVICVEIHRKLYELYPNLMSV